MKKQKPLSRVERALFDKPNHQWDNTEKGTWVACYGKRVLPFNEAEPLSVEKLRERLNIPSNGHMESLNALNFVANKYAIL